MKKKSKQMNKTTPTDRLSKCLQVASQVEVTKVIIDNQWVIIGINKARSNPNTSLIYTKSSMTNVLVKTNITLLNDIVSSMAHSKWIRSPTIN